MRRVPHDEGLQPIIDERNERQKDQKKPALAWQANEVTCPDCGRKANTRCNTPGGPHRSRVELAKEFTRRREPRPRPGA
ncbi:zinc finger domain-containing protein [Streptomyces gardneri]